MSAPANTLAEQNAAAATDGTVKETEGDGKNQNKTESEAGQSEKIDPDNATQDSLSTENEKNLPEVVSLETRDGQKKGKDSVNVTHKTKQSSTVQGESSSQIQSHADKNALKPKSQSRLDSGNLTASKEENTTALETPSTIQTEPATPKATTASSVKTIDKSDKNDNNTKEEKDTNLNYHKKDNQVTVKESESNTADNEKINNEENSSTDQNLQAEDIITKLDSTDSDICGNDKNAEKHFVITIHTRTDYDQELVLNPTVFPDAVCGDYFEVYDPSASDRKLLLRLTSLPHIRGTLQVSVLKSIATRDDFRLRSFQSVVVRKANPDEYRITYLELSFKDQYVSQGEFWRLRDAMKGHCLFTGKQISMLGNMVQVEEMLRDGNMPVRCGIVQASTKFIFRSGSARLFWLVQMSKEMWDFADDNDLYHERFIKFAADVFERWKEKAVRHSLTIVLFTRTFFNKKPPEEGLYVGNGRHISGKIVKRNYDGRYYVDIYRVIVENETSTDWPSLILVLKKGITEFPSLCGWNLEAFTKAEPETAENRESSQNQNNGNRIASRRGSAHENHRLFKPIERLSSEPVGYHPDYSVGLPPTARLPHSSSPSGDNAKNHTDVRMFGDIIGLPSLALEGNQLEAINICLNILDKHFMDRDLTRTGQAVVVITAGNGVNEADRALTRITKQRMMDNAIGCDVVSLTRAPLHLTPLFVYKPSIDKVDTLDRPHPFANDSLYNTSDQRYLNSSPVLKQQHPTNYIRADMGSVPESKTFSFTGADSDRDIDPASELLTVYNVPHWIHCCYPYHHQSRYAQKVNTAGDVFEPIPENLMFNIVDPRRSCLPVALLYDIANKVFKPNENNNEDIGRKKKQSSPSFSLPTREKMHPWYPLWKYNGLIGNEGKVVTPFHQTPVTESLRHLRSHANTNKNMPLLSIGNVNVKSTTLKDSGRIGSAFEIGASTLSTSSENVAGRVDSKQDSYSDQKLLSKRREPQKKLQALGIYDLNKSKSFDWDAGEQVPLQHHLSRSPMESRKWGSSSNFKRQLLNSQKTSHQYHHMHGSMKMSRAPSNFSIGASGGGAAAWTEELVHVMDKQLAYDSNVFKSPDLKDDPVNAKPPLSSSTTNLRGLSSSGSVYRALNLQGNERDKEPFMKTKSENNKILRFISSNQKYMEEGNGHSPPNTITVSNVNVGSSSSSSKMSPSTLARWKRQPSQKFTKRDDAQQNVLLGQQDQQGYGEIDCNQKEEGVMKGTLSQCSSTASLLSSSLEPSSNRLSWDRRSMFGPGMQVSAPADANSSPSDSLIQGFGSSPLRQAQFDEYSHNRVAALVDDKQVPRRRPRTTSSASMGPGYTSYFSASSKQVKEMNTKGINKRKSLDFHELPNTKDSEHSEISSQGPALTVIGQHEQGVSKQMKGPPELNMSRFPSDNSQKSEPLSVGTNTSLPGKESPRSQKSSLSSPRLSPSYGEKHKKAYGGKGAEYIRQASQASVNSGGGKGSKLNYGPASLWMIPANPFDLREIKSKNYYQRLTHNRRRWSHLFPKGRFTEPTVSLKGPKLKPKSKLGTASISSDTVNLAIKQKSARHMLHHRMKHKLPLSRDGSHMRTILEAELQKPETSENFGGTPSLSIADEPHEEGSEDENDESTDDPLTFESYRPNWKSLQSPGVLPLTTDYCPDKGELDYNYTENFYSLTLPEEPGDFGYKDYDDLILEMVCQRLSQDFQLYIDESKPTYQKSRRHRKTQSCTTYVCTMGHQLHVLDYYPGTREVHVKIYVHRQWTVATVRKQTFHYEYLLFDEIEKTLEPVSLKFVGTLQFYNWNQLDNVVCGYGGDLTSLVRYRRQRFSIIPIYVYQKEEYEKHNISGTVENDPSVSIDLTAISAEGSESDKKEGHLPDTEKNVPTLNDWKMKHIGMDEENRVISGFEKFLGWIQSKASETMKVEILRRYKFIRKKNSDTLTADSVSGRLSPVEVSGCEAEDLDPDIHVVEDLGVTQPFKVETQYARIDLHSSKTGRYEWIQLEYDSVFSPYQCFHLQVQWMVASGSTTSKDFVSIMFRKAKQAGILFEQFPEYCSSTAYGFGRRVQHPLVLPKEIRLPRNVGKHPSYRQALVDGLQVRCGFVMDRLRHVRTNGENVEWLTLVHKDGYAFLHLGCDVIEVVRNLMKPKEIVNQFTKSLFSEIKTLIHRISDSYDIVNDTIENIS